VLQAGIYQNLVVLYNFFPAYLMLCADDKIKFEETLKRAEIIADTFDMQHLHPGVLVALYINAAHGYMMQNHKDRALDMLEQYAKIITDDIYPLRLHGDTFFDLLENWFDKLDIGNALPRDEKTIRQSMADVISKHPALIGLHDDPRFLRVTAKLQDNLK
jgi:hypothetical protein